LSADVYSLRKTVLPRSQEDLDRIHMMSFYSNKVARPVEVFCSAAVRVNKNLVLPRLGNQSGQGSGAGQDHPVPELQDAAKDDGEKEPTAEDTGKGDDKAKPGSDAEKDAAKAASDGEEEVEEPEEVPDQAEEHDGK